MTLPVDDFLRRRQPSVTQHPPVPAEPSIVNRVTTPTSREPFVAPAAPPHDFLLRRPRVSLDHPDPVRTGDPARDFSDTPIRGGGAQTELLRTPVEFVRGRRILNPDRPTVRLGSPQTDSGSASFTLTWQILQSRRGRPSTDIHLGCMWQTVEDEVGAIQSYGNQVRAPRSGSALLSLGARSETSGETLTMALSQLPQLSRMVIYLYAYSGHPDWRNLLPVVTMSVDDARIEMSVGDPPSGTTIAALTSIHRVQDTLVVRREVEYLRGQQSAVGTAYGFDMSWSSGHVMPGR